MASVTPPTACSPGAGRVVNGSPLATLVPSVPGGRAVVAERNGPAGGHAPSLGACMGHVSVAQAGCHICPMSLTPQARRALPSVTQGCLVARPCPASHVGV